MTTAVHHPSAADTPAPWGERLVFAVVVEQLHRDSRPLSKLVDSLAQTITPGEHAAWAVRLYLSAERGTLPPRTPAWLQLRHVTPSAPPRRSPRGEAVERAFTEGAAYVLQAADIAVFTAREWLTGAVHRLRRLSPPNVGLATFHVAVHDGARDRNGSVALHVVHRSHLRIFTTCYPPQLSAPSAEDAWLRAAYAAATGGRAVVLTRRHNWGVTASFPPTNMRVEKGDAPRAPPHDALLAKCGAYAISAYLNASHTTHTFPPVSCGIAKEEPTRTHGTSRIPNAYEAVASANVHACCTQHDRAGDAVMIEMRPLRRLADVLRNFLQLLPPGWTTHFLHAEDNYEWVRATLQPYIRAGALMLRSLREFAPAHYPHAIAARDASRHGPIARDRVKHLSAVHWYDNLLMGTEFWRAFASPLLLLFQADSALCPSPLRGIHDFGDNYVFTGAPWSRNSLWLCRNSKRFRCVGNSGLSLWRRGIMLRLLRSSRFRGAWGSSDHMDVYITQHLQHNATLEELGGYDAVPRDHEASLFSIEAWYPGMHALNQSTLVGYTPIGVHQPHAFHSEAHLAELWRRCPAGQALSNLSQFA